jgi:hypothetical protein
MNKFERDENREIEQWKKSRFLDIMEREMDNCLKTKDAKTISLLYNIYVAQRRWLFLYKQETKKALDGIIRNERIVWEAEKKNGKRAGEHLPHSWSENFVLGAISAIGKINEDMSLCSCKKDKRVWAWVNLLHNGNKKQPRRKRNRGD